MSVFNGGVTGKIIGLAAIARFPTHIGIGKYFSIIMPETAKLVKRMSTKKCAGGGGYCHIWAIEVCAAVKGMVFKQFTLG